MKRSDFRSRHNGRDDSFDVAIVGAGFAGLYMLHRLRGLRFSARVYEQADGVGGTWYWNRPNLFAITGPGSPSVLSNMLPSIEQHVDWIADLLDYARKHRRPIVEAMAEAEDAWVAHVNDVANRTVFPSCNSWYLGANVPGKPRVFMPYPRMPAYVCKCDRVAACGYEGFELNEAPVVPSTGSGLARGLPDTVEGSPAA